MRCADCDEVFEHENGPRCAACEREREEDAIFRRWLEEHREDAD